MPETKSETYERNLAFLQRLFSVRARPFQNLEARASNFLKQLDQPAQNFKFRVLLQSLRLQFDLLDEESALEPAPRRLQVRIIELAKEYPTARLIAEEMLFELAVGVLFFSIVGQTLKAGGKAIRIVFKESEDQRNRIYVNSPIGWAESMTIPANVGRPLRGYAMRVADAGYDNVKEYIKFKGAAAEAIEFNWLDEDTLELQVR